MIKIEIPRLTIEIVVGGWGEEKGTNKKIATKQAANRRNPTTILPREIRCTHTPSGGLNRRLGMDMLQGGDIDRVIDKQPHQLFDHSRCPLCYSPTNRHLPLGMVFPLRLSLA